MTRVTANKKDKSVIIRAVNLCRWLKNIFLRIFGKKIKKNIPTCKRIFPYEIEYYSILKPLAFRIIVT